jgi:hypothetical protein
MVAFAMGGGDGPSLKLEKKRIAKDFQASFAGRIGNTEAKLAGVPVPGNRTNLPA